MSDAKENRANPSEAPAEDDKPIQPAGFTPSSDTRRSEDIGRAGDETLSAAQFQPLNTAARTRRGIHWSWVLAGAAGCVVLACLFFLLTARSLDVEVKVVGEADVSIDGLVLPLGSRYLIRPGEYAMRVTVPGYEEWQGSVTVTDANSQQFEVSPAILPGRVSIDSTPDGATVTLGEKVIGQTPLKDQSIEAGDYELTVAAPRYQPYQQPFTVTGRGIEQTLSIDLAPDWAEITVNSTPPGAELLVDGVPTGTAGSTVEILSGDRELTLRAPGYLDKVIPTSVVAGVNQDLGTFALTAANGVLELASDPVGANVTVDGEFEGRTPLNISLAPGEQHVISLSRAGYARKSLKIALEKGSAETRTVALDPLLGDIQFDLSPADAELVINGKSQGVGSQSVSLPSVEHRVEVRLDGYAAQRLRVVPRPGLRQVVEIALLTESEARKAAMLPEVTSALGQTLLLIDPVGEPMNEFSMGASRREPGRRSNEVLHTVVLDRAFYIATTETTNAQFRQFLASHDSGQIEGNSLNREHQPAVKVSWQQAARFCNWLSAKEGLTPFYRDNQGIINGYNASSTGYRLPTEAEWSYAARVDGENYRRFAWGEDFPPAKAIVNVADNTSALVTGRILNGYADGHIVAAPVGSFPANHRGLHDMGGNVAEWVHDVYAIPSANAEVAANPLGALSGDNYTVRGGSWALSRLAELRLTFRDYGAAGRDDLGFRIARYAE